MEPLDYQKDDLDMITCCDCNVKFFPINEEAIGYLWEYGFTDPPEVRCGDCQVAFRLKGSNKPKNISHADWVYTKRTNMIGYAQELQARNNSGENINIHKTMCEYFRSMYVSCY